MKKIYFLLTFAMLSFLANAQEPFITTWQIYSDDYTIYTPIYGTDNNYTVDFGDGTILTNQTQSVSHTYTSLDYQTITISGNFNRISVHENDKAQLLWVEQWGDTQWSTMEDAFNGCIMLNINSEDMPDLSQATSTGRMFYNCSSVSPNLNSWDVSNITDMSEMFYGCTNFMGPIDNWDVSNVTNMFGMFNDCHLFNSSLNNWDVSNVVNMSGMFANTDAFNQPLDNWDVSNVTNMASMFNNADNFNQSINNWDTSSITDTNGMFANTFLFNQPLNDWDVSNVTDMNAMFTSAHAFNQPLNNWDVSNVLYMTDMFAFTDAFNQSLSDWDVSNVISIAFMFDHSVVFNQPLNNWDTSSVTEMAYAFSNTYAFNQPINSWNVSSVENMSHMFDKAYVFDQPLNDWDVSMVENMSYMFLDAPLFNQPLNSWDVNNVTTMKSMLKNATNFNQDISDWNFNEDVDVTVFLNNCGLNINNYENLLLRFIQLEIENKTLGALDMKYCDSGLRNYLIEQLNWSILGDSLAEDCQGNNIAGNIIFDETNNGCDTEDPKANNFLVTANDGNFTYSTISSNGEYDLSVMEGSYTIQLLNLPDYYTATPATATIEIIGLDNEEELNFCLTANEQVADLNITVLPLNEARPGFASQYRLLVHNIGTQTINDVYASFSYNEEIQQFSEASEETSSATGNELTFSLGSISPFESKFVDITMETFAPPTVEGGEIISFNATVTPNTNDNTPNDNNFSFNQPVVNSFDPNDKRVVQGEEIYIEEAGEYLDYIIRFQNTGSASAITVRIEDVLHENLDWNTFTPITASHNYRVEITDGNQVSFIFNDIYLPHEDADEEGSHGFVAYKIKPVQDIEIGDMITGTAGIYFDYNLPIITNSANTEVIELLGLNDFSLSSISVYPNPAKSILNIQTDGNTIIEGINIYNIEGREILNLKGQTETINIQNLSEGVYFMNIQTNKGISKHKLIKN
ncbi:BspA family leucine-rich repeat surface protein [Flavobacterium sp.]|uniref:BspA family leucine-rich repeat surface protein n=1 Tax=Flavobacterium sp. TaxID=239 RepID=UPI003A9484FA